MAELLKLSSALVKAEGSTAPTPDPFPFEVDGVRYEIPAASLALGAENVFAWAVADDNQSMAKAALRGLSRVADPAALAALRGLDQADLFGVVNAWIEAGQLGKSSGPGPSSAATKRRRRTTGATGSGSVSA